MSHETAVGVIGLGRIGEGVARSLARSGHRVAVCDVRPEIVAALSEVAAPAGSPAELARTSEVMVVAVVDDDQVRTVLTGAAGALTTATAGSTVVIVSTVTLATITDMASAARAKGVALLDAGVTGGQGPALRGSLVTMVGGDPETVEKIRPVLEGFSSLVVPMGPLGSGMKAKLARNLVVYGTWLVQYQAQLLAETAGIELARLRQVIEASEREIGPGGPFFLQRETVAPFPSDSGDLARRTATAALAHKDLRAAILLAEELQIPLPLADLTDRYIETVMGFRSQADVTGLVVRPT